MKRLMEGRKSKEPSDDLNLKGFISVCSCNSPDKEHIDGNLNCGVEKLMLVLEGTGALSYVFDIIDVKPIAFMDSEAENVKHDEVTE